MPSDDETLIELADPARGQYFLSSPDKLALVTQAAEIRPGDQVVELGAGIGTVARSLPPSASLTLIELDERFVEVLRNGVPRARVIQGDALAVISNIPCDVLLSNLPRKVTDDLIRMLPKLAIRTAIVAIGEDQKLDPLAGHFDVTVVASASGDDFRPPQPCTTLLVKLTRLSAAG